MLAQLDARRVLPVALLVGVGAGLPALFLIPRHPDIGTVELYLAVAAGLLAVVAGGTWLVTWRVVGRALQGWLGCAFVVLGVLMLVSNGVTNIGAGLAPAVEHVDELIGTAIASWLMWRGLTDAEVNAGVGPLLTLCWSIGSGLFVMGLLNICEVNGLLPAWTGGRPSMVVVDVAAAGMWLVVAMVGARSASRGPCVPMWVALIAWLLALGSAARTVFPPINALTLTAAACFFAAAALALGTAVARLQTVLRSEDRLQLGLHRALSATRQQAESDQASLEEWLHDLRNAVAGLQAADAVLRSGAPAALDRGAGLADAVTAELARLHALVDPARGLRFVECDLGLVLEPIVAAERAAGSSIELQLEAAAVHGDPETVCRVLQNVLSNARRYAPGTPVLVHAENAGGEVRISVQDAGPGVPTSERSSIFERGVRGASGAGTPGSGLGLYVARTLLRAMGGRIDIATTDGPGCCVVITLPAAGPAADEVAGEAWIRSQDLLEPAV